MYNQTWWSTNCFIILLIINGHILRSCGRFFNPQFGPIMEDITVRTGVSVEFQCTVKHLGRNMVAFSRVSDPPMLISWDVNIFSGIPSKYTLERKEDMWILSINNVQPSDAGAYMCQVNSVPQITQIANLHVMVPPLINKERSSKDTFVNEGQNATLICSADGSPPPAYSWRRKAENYESNVPQMIITNDPDMGSGESIIHRSNFTIYKVTRHHMANYECIASNGVDPSDSYTVKLHVLYPPQVEAIHEKVYAIKGSDIRLQCKAQAWPRPNFVWEFNKHVITNYPEKYHMTVKPNSTGHDSIATLTIRNLVDEDFGNYYCLASNERSHHKAVIELLKTTNEFYNRSPESLELTEGSGISQLVYDDEDSDHGDLSSMPSGLSIINIKSKINQTIEQSQDLSIYIFDEGIDEGMPYETQGDPMSPDRQLDYNAVNNDQRQTVPRSPNQTAKDKNSPGINNKGNTASKIMDINLAKYFLLIVLNLL